MAPPSYRPYQRANPHSQAGPSTGSDPTLADTASMSTAGEHTDAGRSVASTFLRNQNQRLLAPPPPLLPPHIPVGPTMRTLAESEYYYAPSSSSSSSGIGSRATRRVLAAVRRPSGSSRKRIGRDRSEHGMFSTPEERSVSPGATHAAVQQPPPSIAQIAMGLHTSRTPHLGRATAPATAHASLSASSSTTRVAPLRPSLKNPGTGAFPSPHPSRSASPSASFNPAPRSAIGRFSLAIASTGRAQLDKLLGRVPRSTAASIASLNSIGSSSDGDLTAPRKAVRFVSVEGEVDRRRVVVNTPKRS
ncbi:hypothetical protein M0805_008259 [Coniferiporia weirii]|nr:hypothetical protein M0805_008259 [Coniferiporia weirii]